MVCCFTKQRARADRQTTDLDREIKEQREDPSAGDMSVSEPSVPILEAVSESAVPFKAPLVEAESNNMHSMDLGQSMLSRCQSI